MRSISSFLFSLAITSTLANPGKGGGKGWKNSNNDLTARSKAGTFTGFVDPDVPDVAQWLGVPYGAPPVGNQRFLPPKPAAYAGELSTTSYKPICMQNGGPGQGVFWKIVVTDPQAEDCLYLNIWGPRKTTGNGKKWRHQKKVPVIIWSELTLTYWFVSNSGLTFLVCGGGYQEGGGHAPYQVPDHWVQRTQTHIVVTFK
jgi:hypothetical protein